MKRFVLSVTAFAALAFLVTSCASAPGAAERVPVAKERQETVRIPVLVSETVYLADGSLDRKVVYTLDAAMVEVVRRVFTEASRTEPVETLVRELAPGRVVETTRDRDGQLVSRKTITLDAAGRRVRETLEGSRSVKGSVSEWDYDAAGLQLAWRVRDASGALLATTEYLYAGGKLKTARFLAPSGDFEGKLEHEYDGAGQLKSRTLSGASGIVERTELFAYKDGVLVEERSLKGSAALEQRIVHEIGPDRVPLVSLVYDGAARLRERRVYEYVMREETRTVVYYE